MTAHSPQPAGELANDSSAETRRAEAEKCDEAGTRAGRTAPNNKTAGGARGLLLSWLELTSWVEDDQPPASGPHQPAT